MKAECRSSRNSTFRKDGCASRCANICGVRSPDHSRGRAAGFFPTALRAAIAGDGQVVAERSAIYINDGLRNDDNVARPEDDVNGFTFGLDGG